MKVNVKKSVLWSLKGIENIQVEAGEGQEMKLDLANELISAGFAEEVEAEVVVKKETKKKTDKKGKK